MRMIITRILGLWLICIISLLLAIQIGGARNQPVLTFKSEMDDINDIYLYDPTTGMTHNITQSIYTEWSFAWSAQGILLYTAAVNPGQATDELFTMSRLGEAQIIDTPDSLYSFGGSWSPDGRTLAYFSSHPRNYSDIFIIETDSGIVSNLTETPLTSETHPLWSPDGQSMLFLREDDLYIAHLSTGNITRIADLFDPIDNAVWSPDGETIVFFTSSFATGRTRNVAHRVAPDGTGLQQLDLPEIINTTATWSPDSTQIALIANNTDILLYTLSDNSYQLIPSDERRYAPSWSPDGSVIAFIEGRRIYLFDAETESVQLIAYDGFVTRPLLWKP
ncbi:MAG: hypothetical protein AAFR81_01370 [Chloroflexota bacterium]